MRVSSFRCFSHVLSNIVIDSPTKTTDFNLALRLVEACLRRLLWLRGRRDFGLGAFFEWVQFIKRLILYSEQPKVFLCKMWKILTFHLGSTDQYTLKVVHVNVTFIETSRWPSLRVGQRRKESRPSHHRWSVTSSRSDWN